MIKELYRFVEGSNVWTLTSSDSPEIYDAGQGEEIYQPSTIGRNEVESKNELSRANLEVSLDIDNAMARRWMRQIIDDVVSLTVFGYEEGDVSVIWKGRLVSVKPDISQIVLIFESIFTSLRRSGLRKKYQRACPHVLYGRGCFLNKDDWAVFSAMPAISADGTTVAVPQAAAFQDGYFSAGMLQAPDGTFRFITGHQGGTVKLIRPIDSLNEAFANSGYGFNCGNYYGGISVNIYPGCDRSKETCKNKFANLLNYGGFAFIPLKNPFGGSSIV